MLKLNPLKKYLSSGFIDSLEKDNLFQEFTPDVIADIKTKSGIDLQVSEPTPEMLKPLANIFAYLVADKNKDIIDVDLLNNYKSNYNSSIAYFIDNKTIESNSKVSELIMTGRIHSYYGLR